MDIGSLTAAHNSLAKRIKQYEQRARQFPPTDVLNEIRYGFRAALELLDLADFSQADPDKLGNLNQRIKHAIQCAYHDLVDGIVIEIMRLIDDITEQFPESSYAVAGDRLLAIADAVAQVEERIAESRGKPKDRATIYEATLYEQWFDKLADDLAFIQRTAIPNIVKHDIARRKRARRVTLLTILSILVTVIVGSLAFI